MDKISGGGKSLNHFFESDFFKLDKVIFEA
jgi:hypothetical protein